MSRMTWFRCLAWGALTVLCLSLFSLYMLDLKSNLWSVAVSRAALWSGLASADLSAAPASNGRAPVWQGLAALERANPRSAAAILGGAALEAPNDSMLHLLLGDAYEREGRIDDAIGVWRQAGAWQELIRAAQRAVTVGRWDDALKIASVVESKAPQEVVSLQAQALNGKKESGPAVRLLRDSIASRPASRYRQEWLVLLGDYSSRAKDWRQALAAYGQAAELNGDGRARALIGAGEAMYFDGRGEQAALSEIQQGIDLAPQDSLGYMTMGDVLRSAKRYAEADVWYARASEKQPSDPAIIMKRADNLIEANQLDQARQLLVLATRQFASVPHFYYQLATLYEQSGDLNSAITYAQESVALDNSANAGYRVTLARLYEKNGQHGLAIQSYREALVLNDYDAQVHGDLGQLLYNAGYGADLAEQEFRRAIEVEPQNAVGYTRLGQLFEAEKEYQQADTWFRQATERSPDDPWPWTMRGENALSGGDVALAIQTLEQTTTRFPNFPHAYLFLAQAYRRAGNREKAVAAIAKTVALAPTSNVWYWVTAGQIYEWVGQVRDAREAYQMAASLDSTNAVAGDGLARLRGVP
jgi:tetratricopeptide (TPR) repeat protein